MKTNRLKPHTKEQGPARIATRQGGFTLLEVLIAITILVFAITATFTAAQSGLSAATESKNQVVAYYLAQEAVEYIRNMRDTNALAGNSWLAGFANPGNACDPSTSGGSCTIDTVAGTIHICPTGANSCPALTQDTNPASPTYGMYGDAYGDSAWATSPFKREIVIRMISTTPNNSEASMTVTVSWMSGSIPRSFVVHESIFNWQS